MDSNRYDRATELAAPIKRDDGTRIYDAVLATSGVHEYPWGREYTPPEVLAKAAASAAAVPVVALAHPDANFSTISDAAPGRVGVTSAETTFDGKSLRGRLIIDTEEGGRKVDDEKLSALSPGLQNVQVLPEKGTTPDGEEYDFRRVSMSLNHIAMLRPGEGRQGPEVGFRADSIGTNDPQPGKTPMAEMTLSGVKYDVPAELVPAIQALQNETATQTERADTAETAKSELAGTVAALTERADKAEQDLQSRMDSADSDRAQWLKVHEALKPIAERFDVELFDGDTVRPHDDVRRDCVAAHLGDEWRDADRHDAAEVRGAFPFLSAATERADASVRETFGGKLNINAKRPVTVDAANADLIARMNGQE